MITVQSREQFLTELQSFIGINSNGAEIGVLYGDFSQMLLETLNPKSLLLIDPYTKSEKKYDASLGFLLTAYSGEYEYQNLLSRFLYQISAGQVTVLKKFSYEAVSEIEDCSLDWVYIDGSHLYEDVKRDLNDWFPKVKTNGIIMGHDYTYITNFGVIQAVDEFKQEHGYEFFIFNQNGSDWAIKKI